MAYEMRMRDWSSDVCSSDLLQQALVGGLQVAQRIQPGIRQVQSIAHVGDDAFQLAAAQIAAARPLPQIADQEAERVQRLAQLVLRRQQQAARSPLARLIHLARSLLTATRSATLGRSAAGQNA